MDIFAVNSEPTAEFKGSNEQPVPEKGQNALDDLFAQVSSEAVPFKQESKVEAGDPFGMGMLQQFYTA
jgi:hypothetical protein